MVSYRFGNIDFNNGQWDSMMMSSGSMVGQEWEIINPVSCRILVGSYNPFENYFCPSTAPLVLRDPPSRSAGPLVFVSAHIGPRNVQQELRAKLTWLPNFSVEVKQILLSGHRVNLKRAQLPDCQNRHTLQWPTQWLVTQTSPGRNPEIYSNWYPSELT